MTNEELNLFIAEKLEPKPGDPPNAKTKFITGWFRSPMEEWHWDEAPEQWRHTRDFCSDPACTVRLQFDLLEGCDLKLERSNDNVYVSVFNGRDTIYVQAETLGRAVAETFALANGLAPEELK